MIRKHAILSASGAERWYHCPPSARLEEALPDTTSIYAAEGTLAHRVAELGLKKLFHGLMVKDYNAEMRKIKQDPLYVKEMLTNADIYINYIKSIAYGFASPPYVAVEERLDYSHVAPEGFGTGDCVIIGGAHLYIVDYKYGQGVRVSAEKNLQMILYALGALARYQMLFHITHVTMIIIQPRLNNISDFTMTREQLSEAAKKIKFKAELAYEGKGDFKAGEWCRFCRAGARCRARSTEYTAFEDFVQSPNLLTNQEIGDILRKTKLLKAWADDVEKYALSQCLAGEEIPGWKAVAGRSVRKFTDSDAAFEVLTSSGINEAVLYERKPLTLAAIEKMLGKKQFTELLKDYVHTPAGKPTLAPASDNREPITLKTTAKEDFENGSEDE